MSLRDRYTRFQLRIREVEYNGEKHYLRNMRDSERTMYESNLFDDAGKVDKVAFESQRRRLLAIVLCDETGDSLFNARESELLQPMDSALSGVLYDEALKHCFGERVTKQAKEETEKKLEPAASDSPSASV